MKKKKVIYFLLPIIVLVWAFVFYQLFGYFFSEPNYAKEHEMVKMNIDEIKADTFSIVANYRDPFLDAKKVVSQSSHRGNSSSTKKKKTLPPVADKLWPVIKYNGMIKNNDSERRVGIVSISGKEYLVKEGDVLDEVKVKKIEKDLIAVVFQKEQKTISK
jgi:Tfp pilus assembly protein PilP